MRMVFGRMLVAVGLAVGVGSAVASEGVSYSDLVAQCEVVTGGNAEAMRACRREAREIIFWQIGKATCDGVRQAGTVDDKCKVAVPRKYLLGV